MAFDPEHIAKKVMLCEAGWTWNRKLKQWERGGVKVKRMAEALTVMAAEQIRQRRAGEEHDAIIQ